MKGQFFVFGAVLMCVLFYMSLPLLPEPAQPTSDLQYIADNLEMEFPRALSMGLNESRGLGHLENFTGFVYGVAAAKSINFRALWVVALPQDLSSPGSSATNVTAGNWFGAAHSVNVTLYNSTWSQSAIMSPASGNTSSSLFTGVPALYNLTVKFNSTTGQVSMCRGKAGIYLYFALGRGADRSVREVVA